MKLRYITYLSQRLLDVYLSNLSGILKRETRFIRNLLVPDLYYCYIGIVFRWFPLTFPSAHVYFISNTCCYCDSTNCCSYCINWRVCCYCTGVSNDMGVDCNDKNAICNL